MQSSLSQNTIALQKVKYNIEQIKHLRWNDKRVFEVAQLVRNTFDKFEQEWRDGLGNNEFFVFCLPRYAVYDGPIVFLHNKLDPDAVTQQKFETGCTVLLPEIDSRLKKMQDRRGRLFGLKHQGWIDDAVKELDAQAYSLVALSHEGPYGVPTSNSEIDRWDAELASLCRNHGLEKFFSLTFADSQANLGDRVRTREESISSMIETLSHFPSDKMLNGGTTVNIGDNNNIGMLVNGNAGDMEQININVTVLQKSYPGLADRLKSLAEVIDISEAPQEKKEQALDSIECVSNELGKAETKRKNWKITKNLNELKDLLLAGGGAYAGYEKIEPQLKALFDYIQNHLPNIL